MINPSVIQNNISNKFLNDYLKITKEIDMVYCKILFGFHIDDSFISSTTYKQWMNKIELFLNDVENPVSFSENFSKKLNVIQQWIQLKSPHHLNAIQPLALINPPFLTLQIKMIYLEKNNFELWLKCLKIKLLVNDAENAIESPLDSNDPQNLIAKGHILKSISPELQLQVQSMNVAFDILKTIKKEYLK